MRLHRRGLKCYVTLICVACFVILTRFYLVSLYTGNADYSGYTKHDAYVHVLRKTDRVPSTGEDLARRVLANCKRRQPNMSRFKFPVTSNRNHNLLFCPMCKLASTYWTKFFRFLNVKEDPNRPDIVSPFDIPIDEAPPTNEKLAFNNGSELSGYRYNGLYRYMFVRDPYSRIVSSYVDKIFAPNPTFWRVIGLRTVDKYRAKGSPQSLCGSDLRFTEYVKAIIDAHKIRSGSVDCHDATFISYCHPCETKYDFIGKMETFVTDSEFIYYNVNLSDTADYLAEKGNKLADDEALMDTVVSPFLWKDDIKQCITWRKALKRIWRKLQIRGVIGKADFPLDEIQSDAISRDGFIRLIKDTQDRTPYSVRKRQRLEALVEIFSDVTHADMEALRHVYLDDFDLFEYDSRPHHLFNISSSLRKFGYLNVD